MTRKELNLAIFEGTADKVLWQPRLETWYWHHRTCGTLPARYQDLDYLPFYDSLKCSVRYASSTGLESHQDRDDVELWTEPLDEHHEAEVLRMSIGELRKVHKIVWNETGQVVNRRVEKFPVQTIEDLGILIAFVEGQYFRIDVQAFEAAAARVGHRAEPTLFTSSDGFTELIKSWSGLEAAHFLLFDHPVAMDAYVEAWNRREDRLFAEVLKLPCRLFNLGDHTINEFTPPPVIERYCLPRWQKISRLMGENGRYCHSHWDGHSRLILKYLQPSGLQAVEALTPEPMGDMTLEMIRDAIGEDMVVLDLIPAIYFLPSYSTETVIEFVKRAVDMFAPRLILGISDEISEVGQIEKVEAVTEYLYKTQGLPD